MTASMLGICKEARYAFSEQEVKQYFTAPKVLAGLFKIVETLFEVAIRKDSAPVWKPGVEFYRIERNGELVGQFYLDQPARTGKRGGAWMDDVRARWLRPDTGKLQTPVAHLVCNFADGVGNKPALLTHDDVTTLFHEFGHGLHHMLTQVNERDVSGISGVEWDAVELPSQFMENFCWEWDVLKQMTAHVDTGEPLPRALFEKMLAAKNFQSGMQTLRQVEFSLFDMLLHTSHNPADDLMGLLRTVRKETAVISAPAYSRTPHITLGQDANPFVQITPRLGNGNLYLEQGSSLGTVTAAASAAGLQLAGLETLFRDMSESLAKPAACGGSTGLQRSLAGAARLSMGGHSAQGAAQVAEALCGFFALGEDGNTPLWGSRLLSPTLGRCDLGGPEPVCRVSFVLQSPTGDVQSVGSGLGVTKEAGVWKFVGDLLPIEVHASARAQRTVRIDTPTAVIDYDRAIAFEVSAVPGLACARFAQRDASGAPVTVAYYKRHPGATQQARLSLWTPVAGAGAGTGAGAASGTGASLDPMVGATRSEDDSWLALPQGVDGDAMVRNFYRGGRSVSVSLFGDAACSTPFAVGGESVFEVEVDGVPPVWSAMPNLPWPEIDADTHTALRALTLGAGADGSLRAAWTFNRGPLGLNDATVCASRADCGKGGSGRLGERSLRPGAREATLALHNRGSAVESTDARTISLNGRNGEGVGLSSNFSACPQVAAGQACR